MINWKASIVDGAFNDDVMRGATLSVPKSQRDVFGLFNIDVDQKSLTWDVFKDKLERVNKIHAQFIANALRNTVISALSPGPIDNEQFFVSDKNELHRIIITRHYSYYDGSRLMHVYFIPMLPRYEREGPSMIIALLNVAARYRMIFLAENGKFSYRNISVDKGDRVKCKSNVELVVRNIFLIEDESHAYGIDDPRNYFALVGSDVDPDEVVKTFKEWNASRDGMFRKSSEVMHHTTEDDSFDVIMQQWLDEYKKFIGKTSVVNRTLGVNASQKVLAWFNASPQGGPGSETSRSA